jgi:polyisoprenoid-binding protein YceI
VRLAVPFAVLALAVSAGAFAKNPDIKAPKGGYTLDLNHASLTVKILHFGLSNYTVRFTRFEAALALDPANVEKSSVTASIDPTSIETDFPGDYKASHKDSPYASFDEALSKGPKYLNSGTYSTIGFKSTSVKAGKQGHLLVTGDLTFLGQTHPVTLDAVVVGSMEKHPYLGKGMIGFSATTKFNRSEWGMAGTQQFLGDEINLTFEGEFQQTDGAAAK